MKVLDLTNDNNSLEKTNELKKIIIEYVEKLLDPEKELNMDMVITVLYAKFPELINYISELSFSKGYEQAYIDFEELKNKQ